MVKICLPNYISLEDLEFQRTVKICFNETYTFTAEEAIVKKHSILLRNLIEGDASTEIYPVNLPCPDPEFFAHIVVLLKSGVFESIKPSYR